MELNDVRHQPRHLSMNRCAMSHKARQINGIARLVMRTPSLSESHIKPAIKRKQIRHREITCAWAVTNGLVNRAATVYHMNKTYFVFTDGSAIGNPGPAGWAAIVIHGTRRQEIAGSVPWSTVSEMELRAAVEALRLTPSGARIELRSDSELLIHGMRFRVFRWRRYGWRNSRGFDLQHQELWRLCCAGGYVASN